MAHGWPIGTGVVEGACGRVVKDGMEQAGMRWIKAGAQAMLALRVVRLSGDGDDYWAFHRHGGRDTQGRGNCYRSIHDRIRGQQQIPPLADCIDVQVQKFNRDAFRVTIGSLPCFF